MTRRRSPEDLLRAYLDAGLRPDHAELLRCYAPDFDNVRIGLDKTIVRLDRESMAAHLGTLWASGGQLGPADDVNVLATASSGRFGSVVFERFKDGSRYIYTFIFDLSAPGVSLVQEITIQTGQHTAGEGGTGS